MGILLLESPSEQELPSDAFTYWKFERADGLQGWGFGGRLVGFWLSAPPGVPSRLRKMTRHWALVCSTPFVSFWPKDTPVEKTAGLPFGDNRIQWTIQIICHLLGLTSSLVLFPEIRRNFVFLHSYYLSIKNLPTQLPLHGGLSRRETCSVFPPSLFTWVCDFSSLNKPSLPLLPLPFHLPLHPASEVTADPGLMLSTGSFPLPPNCTYRAAQIIWFHDQRSNSGHSYSHSATGLCKNPLGHCPYPP